MNNKIIQELYVLCPPDLLNPNCKLQVFIIFISDWHVSVHGHALDWESINADQLNILLRKFYCEVRPNEKKSHNAYQSAESCQAVFHKNTMKNIRAALNRHLSDIGKWKFSSPLIIYIFFNIVAPITSLYFAYAAGRIIDIVQGEAFKPANRALNGLLKTRCARVYRSQHNTSLSSVMDI